MVVAASVLTLAGACTPRNAPPVLSPPAPAAPPAGVRNAQAQLDRFIEETWRAAGVTPAPVAGDGEFLRRATLDLVGRIPTLDEARAFLNDRGPDKRARAVDALLASRGFAEHWADVYAGLLFGTEGKQKARMERRADPQGWLEAAFHDNRGWDRITLDLLTASGDLRENGATAFIVSRASGGGGPEAVTGAAARIFLGLQIQCAQCHDHPYDARWKQEDFYGLVGYFARTKARNEKLDPAMADDMAMMAPSMDPSMEPATPQGQRARKPERTYVLFDARRGQAKMRRPGAESDVVVQPRFLGRPLVERRDETRRQVFARAVVGSDLFAKTMVARTWAQLFGRGLVDPWDDLGGENDPKHPPALVHLADDFRASGHDIKRLVRLIVLSTAYARSSAPPPGVKPDDDAAVRVFARAGLRPLLPEQLVRSLASATGIDRMARRRSISDEQISKRLAAMVRDYTFVFGDDEMAEVNSFDGSVPQALLLMNGDLTNQGTRAAPGGVLNQILAASGDPERRLEDMFLAVYTRAPSPEERNELGATLRDQRSPRAYEDLFFALVTSVEAITNH